MRLFGIIISLKKVIVDSRLAAASHSYRATGYQLGDNFFYNIPLAKGTYEIRFKFADYHQWQSNTGNLIIEDAQVLTSYEPEEYWTAYDTTFTVKVEDGELNMQFVNDEGSVGDFFINGIYIQELTEVFYSLETIADNGTITLDPVGGHILPAQRFH